MEVPIVACATPWGVGAIAVVRLSGPELGPLVEAVCGRLPSPRQVSRVFLRDAAGIFDDGLLTWMPAPRSYTGEDVAEVSCHGNPLLVERLLAAFVAAGARIARPGEFTRRALLHGKMDLTRAEAVLQTLEATSAAGLSLAQAGRDGKVAEAAEPLRAEVVDVAAELEAILDYPGEDLLFSTDMVLCNRLTATADRAAAIARSFQAGRLAIEGAKVVLTGPVNAGKSSLFNALLGRSRALVSATPGTTRDVVESSLQLPTMRILLLDTAGLRETLDPIEAEGVQFAQQVASEADLRLIIFPLHQPLDPEIQRLREEGGPHLLVGTHLDRVTAAPDLGFSYLPVSSRDSQGIEMLKTEIAAALRGEEPGEVGLLLGSQRQRDIFEGFGRHLRDAVRALEDLAGPAVAVESLYAALSLLDSLSGRDTRETVLDRLFQRFCVGK